MTLAHVVVLLATGVATGLASGLLGIGGGIIMTPVQYMVYSAMGLSTDIAIRLTFGTSLLVVIPTSVSAALRHHRQRPLPRNPVLIMGGCSLVAAFAGAAMAAHVPGSILRTAFGIIVLASLARMMTATPSGSDKTPQHAAWHWVVLGLTIGIASGILGVGGGIMLIPVLVVVLGFGMHEAVGISLGVVAFTSVGGGIGYIVNGLSATGLPAYSMGYVYLPAWFLLTVTSISTAQIGALIAHRLPAKHLKYLFTVVLFYFGLKMTGIFELLGLPL